MSSLRKK